MSEHTLFYLVSKHPTFLGTGIDRVTVRLFESLAALLPSDWNITPVTIDRSEKIKIAKHLMARARPPQRQNIRPFVSTARRGDVLVSIDLNLELDQRAIQLISREFKARKAKIFFVLYDLLPLRHPEWFSGEEPNGYQWNYPDQFRDWLLNLTSVSDHAVCISRTVRSDYDLWKKENKRIGETLPAATHFYLGCDLGTDKSPPEHISSDRPFSTIEFLLVGTLERRKSHHLAIDAFEVLWRTGYNVALTFVGRMGAAWQRDYSERLNTRITMHSEYPRRLTFLRDASDTDLVMAYKRSDCLLMLSQDEGFGLPLVEAGRFKLPVVARDAPIFREICGSGAYYLPPNLTGESLAESLTYWMELFRKKKHPTSSGISSVSWEHSARLFLDCVGIAPSTNAS